MKYIDIDFPIELSKCFSGGAEFSTSIALMANKNEVRNKNWIYPRYKYNLQYKFCNVNIFNKLKSFFLLCNGSELSFNYLDSADNKLQNEVISIADGSTHSFQIYKNYSYTNRTFRRKIYKVKDEKVFINNIEVEKNKYEIVNGVIKFTDDVEINNEDAISITATFYVIVRFNIDYLPVLQKNFNSFELPDISLIETNI